jgi:hypothetical protein
MLGDEGTKRKEGNKNSLARQIAPTIRKKTQKKNGQTCKKNTSLLALNSGLFRAYKNPSSGRKSK